MIIPILIDKNGNFLNPQQNQNLCQISKYGQGMNTPWCNQLTLAFYTRIIEDGPLIVPDKSSVVKTGLSGIINISINAYEDAPYPVNLSKGTIDISKECILQWTGITSGLNIVTTDIVGAEYILMLLARTTEGY